MHTLNTRMQITAENKPYLLCELKTGPHKRVSNFLANVAPAPKGADKGCTSVSDCGRASRYCCLLS